MNAIVNEDYKRGQDFAREQIVCNAMPPHDLASYESLFGGSADYDRGVQDAAKAYIKTH